jgi:hypothetical protein
VKSAEEAMTNGVSQWPLKYWHEFMKARPSSKESRNSAKVMEGGIREA